MSKVAGLCELPAYYQGLRRLRKRAVVLPVNMLPALLTSVSAQAGLVDEESNCGNDRKARQLILISIGS